MEIEHYRSELTAALIRIEQLEGELTVYRADPAYELVEQAEERLELLRHRRERARRLLPQVLIGSFAMMGFFALTDPSLPVPLRVVGLILSLLGIASTGVSMLMLVLVQRVRTPKMEALERQVRIAKGDVGTRQLATSLPAPSHVT